MRQIVQHTRSGELAVEEVPEPVVQPGHVLILNQYSVISAGTEKAAVTQASQPLWQRARERPDQVRRVLDMVRKHGLADTYRQVREKLSEPIPLGYSSAGIVLACGEGVQQYKPGDRVASNGRHAGIVCVPKHLCARVPDAVPLDQAAMAVIGSIALQGVRLAKVSLADNVLVIGLGLVGQMTVQLLAASGARVVGVDPDADKCKQAESFGAAATTTLLTEELTASLTGGVGFDQVIIAAATPTHKPIELAGQAVRQRGKVVVVGVVGTHFERQPFYLKEAEIVVSCSYGPGRYDPVYEQQGHDYPIAHVRWTEQRNLQAVLDLIERGQLNVEPLITHRFAVERAGDAYDMIKEGTEPYRAVLLEYDQPLPEAQPAVVHRTKVHGDVNASAGKSIRYGCIGAGGFARAVLLPAIARVETFEPVTLCSASGLTASQAGERLGFKTFSADPQEVFSDPGLDAVFIVTRHDTHASQVVDGLRAGKHVFVEKPLAMNTSDLQAVEQAYAGAAADGRHLMVGFNRRFSPAAIAVKDFFAAVREPLTVSIRFNPGMLPADHWTQDDKIGGGRIIGEACHAVDLATYLAGSPVVRVFAESIGGPHAPVISDDQCFITLRHANGSVSNVAYLAGGDKGFAKERIEVLGGGRMAVIDDFTEVTTSFRGKTHRTRGKQDKGHRAEIARFAEAIASGGEPLISWAELKATTLAAILAVRSLREGEPFELPGFAAARAAAA